MGNGSNNYLPMAIIFAAVLAAVLMAVFLVRAPTSEFEKPSDVLALEQALKDRGLGLCAERDVNWTATPGFVSGKFYDIDTNCSAYDPNKPEARIWVAKFSSNKSRDAALRNFETSRRQIGSGIAWSNGPLIILVDGNQNSSVISILREAVASTGAQKGRA